jgi:tryptophanyl-tRNA synthetase
MRRKTMTKPVILTGLRANGAFHLGNYLGAIQPMINLQERYADEYEINMFVPDLHSFTGTIDFTELPRQIMQNLKTYVASGLDIENENTFIYRQSYVPAHSEMTVILNNFTYYGELQRMTQFKEKSVQSKDSAITAGLFDYPVLMAADILLYGAKYIPVGEDQRQHIELARDIAMRINNKFSSQLFSLPEEWSKQLTFTDYNSGIRIRSLRNPDKKMSKSIDDPAGTILLSDDPDVAVKKIMSATTDSVGVIHYDIKNQPGISNLLQILASLCQTPLNDIIKEWEDKTSYGELKTAVADEVSVFLHDFQRKLAAVNEDALSRKLEASELLMREVSGQRLFALQQAVGLRS